MSKLFIENPRDYALELVERGRVDQETLLVACLKYMSYDDVRDMLEANEMLPHNFAGDEIDGAEYTVEER